ncbi:ParB/RepB/Spo0J family partition protein [Variovorax sp. J22R133]|uniref:ParB/RepB/Spo0J family partition protein n=1 Tax=Variovorax brevis TaxID=3053503 RepID=UPI0025784580|nr:ParB/RepB/Spo0J family partition protein [Variovorax sp. J22R133]MDM0116790.1 ParB/RepB/Spo0J family partition protein [Variovorax sp. J22R133]
MPKAAKLNNATKPTGKKAPKAPASTSADVAVTEPAARDMLVPLDQLVLSHANVRRVFNEDGIAELAALIESQGLLQRLAVIGQADGCFAVVAGGRRLRAMRKLVADGKWSASQPVECKLYEDARAAEVSLAENSGREAMHPADEMEAFRKFVDDGLSVAQVAGRFGVSVLTVDRRLKLARLAPRFLAMYRADEIEPDQLQALALTEDHAAQEAVWDGLPGYDRDAWTIRRMLTEQSCGGDSRLARFVGIDVYEARGGAVRRDLFADGDDPSSVYLDDPVLLQTLAMEKMRSLAEEVRAEGWGWVDCLTEGDNLALRSYGREAQAEREPTPEEAQAIDIMQAEGARLAEAYDMNEEQGDRDCDAYEAQEQRLSAALDELDDKLDTVRAALWVWTPEQMARTGALLRLDHAGQVTVHRGLIRPEDRKAGKGAGTSAGGGAGKVTGGSSASGVAGVDGEDGDGEGAQDTKKRPEFSEKLMRDLTAHRTAALQAALTQNPHVALVTLVHRMAETVFGQYSRGNDVVKVHVHPTSDYSLAQNATGYESSPAGALLGQAETQWGDPLPGNPEAMFSWLLAQDRETLLDLLAYCTARSIDAVAGRERSRDQSDAIAEALGVDMADWWTPSAANYLASVSKAKALEAVQEATGIDSTKAVGGMKKPEAIAYCASKLQGLRWLPAPLRPHATATPGAEADEAGPEDEDDNEDHNEDEGPGAGQEGMDGPARQGSED